MEMNAMIFVFLMLSFKPNVSLSSFTFIKRLFFTFCHKGGVICISEVIDISPSNLDPSLCFIQPSVSHDVQFSSVAQLCLTLCDPWIAAHQASLSITNSQSSLKLMSIKSVIPSSHLILCHPLLLLPPIPPSIRVFSNESTLCMRWPEYWVSALASVLPMNTQDWFPLGWTGWTSLQSKGLLSLLQHHSSKASIPCRSPFFKV